MTTLHPGTKVLFHRPNSRILAVVREATTVAGEPGYIIDTARDPWFATADQLAVLPADALMLRPGDLVRVNSDAPEHPGACGTVAGPEIHGDLFGYWAHFDGERAWIPSGALTVLALATEGGEQQ